METAKAVRPLWEDPEEASTGQRWLGAQEVGAVMGEFEVDPLV